VSEHSCTYIKFVWAATRSLVQTNDIRNCDVEYQEPGASIRTPCSLVGSCLTSANCPDASILFLLNVEATSYTETSLIFQTN